MRKHRFKNNIVVCTLFEDPLPFIRFSTFLEYSLLPPSERTYFLNDSKVRICTYFVSIISGFTKNTEVDPIKHYVYKKQFTVKKKLENKYVFRRKIFIHENMLIITFFKKDRFH